jgi:phage-related protein
MSTRAYDYILQLANASAFIPGNSVIGVSSLTVGEIVGVTQNNVRIKLANVYQSFTVGETIKSNSAVLTTYNVFSDVTSLINGTTNTFTIPTTGVPDDSIIVYANSNIVDPQYYVRASTSQIRFIPRTKLANPTTIETAQYIYPDTSVTSLIIQTVSGNTSAASFVSANYSSEVTTATSTISAISDNPYIAEKNSTQQTPLVKLYTIYYPGEWYPGNANGNPGQSGETFPWPYGFPLRYAEVVGESYSDFNYSVSLDNVVYRVVGSDSGDIDIDSTGRIGELSLSISNFDGVMASIVEDKNLVGYNVSNSALAFVNGELVQNIDPRTISDYVHFNSSVTAARGINAAWDYSSTVGMGETWTSLKQDTRDLLGAVVELKLTYAKFLDHWPEYSIVRSSTANSANVYSSIPYRVGDVITSNNTTARSTVASIEGSTVRFGDTNLSGLAAGSKLLIVNPDADNSSYVEYVYTVNRLDELDEFVAKFNLTNWLQYFKMKVPKRKYVSTTCPWKYKGVECKYPSSGSGNIVSSNPPITANGFFTYSNESTISPDLDICSKTITACSLRRNLTNFGGFTGLKNE